MPAAARPTSAPADLHGLTTAEVVAARRAAPRQRPRGSRSYWEIARANVFTLFNNVLFVIGVTLLALGRLNDAVVSVGLGLVNAMISSLQEMRAKRKLDQLTLLHRTHATVVRDGVEQEVPPEEVVRGDLLRLRAGGQVLVDGPLVNDLSSTTGPVPTRLEVDESLLTGESDVVIKRAGDALLSGSFVVTGSAYQRAEAVGADSYADQVTEAARRWTPSRTPLQREINLVVRATMMIVVLISLAILGQAALEGLPLVRVVQISAVLSGLVPYGLFLLITVSYSVGAATIARHGALVQQVNAVESLSNVNVVCTDKTGTLTSGRLRVETVHPLVVGAGGLDSAAAAHLAGTVARSGAAPNATSTAMAEGLPGVVRQVRAEVPFSSARRWSAVTLAAGEDEGTYVFGAVSALAPALGDAVPADGSELATAAEAYADRGLRVLLLARALDATAALYDEDGQPRLPSLAPVALVVLGDELRPHVSETLAELEASGVQLKVVSGDDPRTVAALLRQLTGRAVEAVSGADLAALDVSDDTGAAFDRTVRTATVFGRIAPEQKERIVDSLMRGGAYVAMVGDGVNDARSLKRAHVGIAMESGSGVTRDIADLVLLGDSFAAILPARHEGRRIFSGLTTALKLFVTRVSAAMLIIVGVGVLGLEFPYEPAQVALTLFTVGMPTFFLTLWARPREPHAHLVADLARFVLPAAVVTATFAVALYASLYTLLAGGLGRNILPEEALTKFEAFTGLARTDADFAETAATAVAQMGLSMFTALTAFLLILFLEPPSRLFTGWTDVRADKRPALLVVALLVIFGTVLSVRPLAAYFGLVQPGGFEAPLVALTTFAWFFALRAFWRFDLLRRALGMQQGWSRGAAL